MEALNLNPSDALLAVKIGRTLVATHDYHRAQNYYDAALESKFLTARQSIDLRHDLAKLLNRLRRFQDAIIVLQVSHTHTLFLSLARVRVRTGVELFSCAR